MLVDRPNNAASLRIRWSHLARSLGLRSAEALGDDLIARYAQPHRVYHTGAHLAQVLTTLADMAADPRMLLAAWFHDAVYDPRRYDNEVQSAALARKELAVLGVVHADLDTIAGAVLATAAHQGVGTAFDALLDADLAILGATPAAYDAYATAIRREYAHVSDHEFAAGRLAFVEAMLARTRLFRTAYGHTRFEAAARANLQRERARLCN
jgi:predicted metal-dependent HD superfamily phosphohydrolase